MKKPNPAEYRNKILARLAEIKAESQTTARDRATVQLDQQSVGRLSRMDAMQQQAMAKATQMRREREAKRLQAALTRLDTDEFGYCIDCGDAIAPSGWRLTRPFFAASAARAPEYWPISEETFRSFLNTPIDSFYKPRGIRNLLTYFRKPYFTNAFQQTTAAALNY